MHLRAQVRWSGLRFNLSVLRTTVQLRQRSLRFVQGKVRLSVIPCGKVCHLR
jgi:hypothetical protein